MSSESAPAQAAPTGQTPKKCKESSAAAAAAFDPQDDWHLISQGAEARLWKIPRLNDNEGVNPFTMAKERFRKKYRHPVLDERLTKQRCRMEGRILEKCRRGGLAVPQVWRVEAPVLYMEYIDGLTVRNLLQSWIESSPSNDDDDNETELTDAVQGQVNQVGQVMGTIIGQLHNLGIIHGDLTTSNMMIQGDTFEPSQSNGDGVSTSSSSSIFLIDFGLAKNSTSEEDRAVDLYVLERALASTHPSLPASFMDETILVAYAKVASNAEKVLQRLEQVRLRGRKRECFG